MILKSPTERRDNADLNVSIAGLGQVVLDTDERAHMTYKQELTRRKNSMTEELTY